MKLALPSQAGAFAPPSVPAGHLRTVARTPSEADLRRLLSSCSEFAMAARRRQTPSDHLPCVATAFRTPSVHLPYSRRCLQAGPGQVSESCQTVTSRPGRRVHGLEEICRAPSERPSGSELKAVHDSNLHSEATFWKGKSTFRPPSGHLRRSQKVMRRSGAPSIHALTPGDHARLPATSEARVQRACSKDRRATLWPDV